MQIALSYAADGFAVFPVYEPERHHGGIICSCPAGDADMIGDRKHSKGKHPRTHNGVSDATTDVNQIKEWWTKWPDASIGIATGSKSRIFVVDLDGAVGISSGLRLGLSSPVTALTGNGKQLFFADTEARLKNSVKKLAPGMDTRGEGGYVVVPPSLHPNGKRYAWQSSPLRRSLLPPIPMSLVNVIAGSSSVEKYLDGTVNPASTIRRKEDGWIADALEQMKRGHIHNTLISVLGKFRSHYFTEEDTFKLLQPYALVNGQPFEGLRDKITEIWKRYQLPAVTGSTEDIDQFLNEMTEVEWICKPFIAKKSIGFVVGLPETMKTWLLMDMAVECARPSGLWLGRFPISPSKVLFIDQERFKGETQRRLNALIAAKGLTAADLKGRLSIKCGTTIRLDLEESFNAFKRELLQIRPEIVMIDSFATFHNSPENDRMAIQQVLNKIKALRDEIGCSFCFINHENKAAYPNGEPQGEPTMGTMAGSVGIGAAAEFCLTVRKVEAGTSIVWHTKSTLTSANKSFYTSIKDVDDGIEIKALDIE